jgi:hypothetical protein
MITSAKSYDKQILLFVIFFFFLIYMCIKKTEKHLKSHINKYMREKKKHEKKRVRVRVYLVNISWGMNFPWCSQHQTLIERERLCANKYMYMR